METGRGFMNVVGGSSAPAIKRGDIPVIDPSDGQEFTTIARGGSEDVELAFSPPIGHTGPFGRICRRRARPIPDETVSAHPRASYRTG